MRGGIDPEFMVGVVRERGGGVEAEDRDVSAVQEVCEAELSRLL